MSLLKVGAGAVRGALRMTTIAPATTAQATTTERMTRARTRLR